MTDYSKELSIARKAANEAAGIIKSYNEKKDFNIDFKGKNDLVTDADLASERKILEIISTEFPDDRILAEESSNEQFLPVDRTWIVDPIDGTTNFAHGFPVFCVSIALWERQQARMGVVLEVNRDEYYTAVKGEGAFLNDRKLTVSSVDKLSHALIGTGFPYNDLSLITNYIKMFEWMLHHTQAIRRPGAAAYDLCCVAAGRFDGFYEYALNPWDVGAASLIVEEAGGNISDWEGDNNWLFGQRIIAGNKPIHAFLLDAIQGHFPQQELRR